MAYIPRGSHAWNQFEIEKSALERMDVETDKFIADPVSGGLLKSNSGAENLMLDDSFHFTP